MDEYILNLLQNKKINQSTVRQTSNDLVIRTDINTPIIDVSPPSNIIKVTPPPSNIIQVTSPPSNIVQDAPTPGPLTMDDIIRKMASSKKVINDEPEVKIHQTEPQPKTETETEIKPEYISSLKNTTDQKIEEHELRITNAMKRYDQHIPKLVFIVPYRDRPTQRTFYSSHMLKILEDLPDTYYKIYYIQQNDGREFNRGAMKNIGFLVIKHQYPTHYKNMTIVFNDIDVMPYTNESIDYETSDGVVKHFYGVNTALGGIVSIKATDFEKTNGFPNAWDWGYDDVIFQTRITKENLTIDYSQFSLLNDGNMISLKDEATNLRLKQRNPNKYNISRTDGFNTITDLNYIVNMEDGSVTVNNFNLTSTIQPVVRRRGVLF